MTLHHTIDAITATSTDKLKPCFLFIFYVPIFALECPLETHKFINLSRSLSVAHQHPVCAMMVFFLQLIIDFLQRHQIGKNWKNLRWKLNFFFGELARGLRWIAFVRWLGQLKGNQLWILQNFTMTQMKRDGLIEWEVRK